LKILSSRYYFLHFSILIALFGCLQYVTPYKNFIFLFEKHTYQLATYKITGIFFLLSVMNALVYMLLFYFQQLRFEYFYKIHANIFLICTITLFCSIYFINTPHYFKKYYAYNEFYKLQVQQLLNISICVSLLILATAQLLLPVNFICSLFKKGNINL